MIFDISNPSPFFCKEEELDYLIWKERLGKLNRKLNYYLAEMSNEDSYFFAQWLTQRKLWCEKCNNQFYSNEGYVNHGCFK